jgi:dsDNA-specific endonuclease/ATPase MutS2
VESSALTVLELPAVLERLAGKTATSRGAELVRSLVPSPDPAEVAARQALTAEGIALVDRHESDSADGATLAHLDG